MAQFPAHVTNLLYTVTSYLVTGLRISVGTWTTYLSLLLKFLGGPVLCCWAVYALVLDAFSVQSYRRRWARFVSLNDVTLLSTKNETFLYMFDHWVIGQFFNKNLTYLPFYWKYGWKKCSLCIKWKYISIFCQKGCQREVYSAGVVSILKKRINTTIRAIPCL